MTVKEAVLAALQETILPELACLKQEQAELKATLALTNRRLDDLKPTWWTRAAGSMP